MAEKILVLEPGDERAQKIAKAMASQTASDILQLLADGQMNLTDIAEHLSLPMNTAKYHVENLLDAGLISVAETKYSVKGREVKHYTLTNQLLIVAPRQSSMRSLILKYASLFGIVVAATLALPFILSILMGTSAHVMMTGSTGNFVPAPIDAPAQADREISVMAAKAAYGAGPAPAAVPDPSLVFFIGGVLVIFILLCYEAWLWKKHR